MADETTALIIGLATYLSEHDVGFWSQTEACPSDQVSICIGRLPETGDAICLTPYPVTAGPHGSATTGVQVTCRADTEDTLATGALADQIRTWLSGMAATTLPNGFRVTGIEHRSGSPMGLDENQREKRADNYYVRHLVAGAHTKG